MKLYNKEIFLQFVLNENLLLFGDFVTKSGRATNFFFNIGTLQSGKKLHHLANFYAQYIIDNNLLCPTIFGPAYKGISLSIATSIALFNLGYEMDFSYNRKEIKTHGEGGGIIGAPLKNEILIIDDVITSGLSINESVAIISAHNAKAKAVIVALDRQEKAIDNNEFAKTQIEIRHNVKVHSLLNLQEIMQAGALK